VIFPKLFCDQRHIEQLGLSSIWR